MPPLELVPGFLACVICIIYIVFDLWSNRKKKQPKYWIRWTCPHCGGISQHDYNQHEFICPYCDTSIN